MQNKSWIIFLVIVVVVVGVIYYRDSLLAVFKNEPPNNGIMAACSRISVADVQLVISKIDSSINTYTKLSKDVSGLSTEGGTQTTYRNDDGDIKLIHQTFYGETFRSEIKYYVSDNKVFFITIDRFEYDRPVSVDTDSELKVQNTVTRVFYLSSEQKLCSWYLDDVMQQNDKETLEFVVFLLSTLELDEN